MNNYKDYKKEAKKTLKSMFCLYDALMENTSVYDRSGDVLESLNAAIFHLGCSICPNECLSIDDFREWLKNN